MDVARLLVRTKGYNVVNETVEATIDGETFLLRIVEDSFGPMRIAIPSFTNKDGRDEETGSSDEEEEFGHPEMADHVGEDLDSDNEERECEGEGRHSLALIAVVNSNEEGFEKGVTDLAIIQESENNSDFSAYGNNEHLSAEDSFFLTEKTGVSRSGPTSSPATSPNLSSNLKEAENRGVSKNYTIVGQTNSGSSGEVPAPLKVIKEGVSSKLNGKFNNSRVSSSEIPKKPNLHLKHSNPKEGKTKKTEKVETCHRNAVGKHSKPRVTSNSISSAGTILCCSSLNSSDIRNCNNQILKRREKEVTSRLWKGAKELGVGGGVEEEDCIRHFSTNEKRDEEGRKRREHNKKVVQ
ncbi:hypothetical protein A2U01_0017235 [Trifolium medium]|uniref:Uncharacterized protein n=1 Tax=Trifolium medium TaxID=97028 RepID=A0A392N9W9_9FABA|nr:hypothetical protein [Trifolium medium]